jgi:hypothetical protein
MQEQELETVLLLHAAPAPVSGLFSATIRDF